MAHLTQSESPEVHRCTNNLKRPFLFTFFYNRSLPVAATQKHLKPFDYLVTFFCSPDSMFALSNKLI